MFDIGYSEAWSAETKDARRQYERAYYRAKNLRNAIERVSPDEFEMTMNALEAAERDLIMKARLFENLMRKEA